MVQHPVSPEKLLKHLLYDDFAAITCLEAPPQGRVDLAEKKGKLKSQITAMQKSKSEYVQLLEKKQRVKAQLKQSIDYDHKYKRIKFDHYQYPYRDNLDIKEKLNTLRMENLEKKRKIKELEEEVKRKQREVEKKRIQKQNIAFSAFKEQQIPHRDTDKSEDFWLRRIENMKTKYLSQDEQFRRAKIRHDYNLLVQKQCGCMLNKTCGICSNLNLQLKTGYSKQALISPRYRSIYGKRF